MNAESRRFELTLIDVDEDPALLRRYGLRVPVLIDPWGEVICEGRLDWQAVDASLDEIHARNRRAS